MSHETSSDAVQPLRVIHFPNVLAVRRLLHDQPDIDFMIGDTLAEYASVTGIEHEYYGLPETAVALLGIQDMFQARRKSLALRGPHTVEDIEWRIRRWLPNAANALTQDAHFVPYMTARQPEDGYRSLGVHILGEGRGSVSYEQDLLTKQVNATSLDKSFRAEAMQRLDLMPNVDEVEEPELFEIFKQKAGAFSGRIALGPVELITTQEINGQHIQISCRPDDVLVYDPRDLETEE